MGKYFFTNVSLAHLWNHPFPLPVWFHEITACSSRWSLQVCNWAGVFERKANSWSDILMSAFSTTLCISRPLTCIKLHSLHLLGLKLDTYLARWRSGRNFCVISKYFYSSACFPTHRVYVDCGIWKFYVLNVFCTFMFSMWHGIFKSNYIFLLKYNKRSWGLREKRKIFVHVYTFVLFFF